MTNTLYGLNTETKVIFTVCTEEVCKAINSGDGFSDHYFVYTEEKDRDEHYKESIQSNNKEG